MDHFYQFDSEVQMLAALDGIGVLHSDDNGAQFVPPYHNGAALDVVGRVVIAPAMIDPETEQLVEPPVFAAGWHLNVRGELPRLEQFEITPPETPARRWA